MFSVLPLKLNAPWGRSCFCRPSVRSKEEGRRRRCALKMAGVPLRQGGNGKRISYGSKCGWSSDNGTREHG